MNNTPHEQISFQIAKYLSIAGVGFRETEFADIISMWKSNSEEGELQFSEFANINEFMICKNTNQLFDILILRLYGDAAQSRITVDPESKIQKCDDTRIPMILIVDHVSLADYAYDIGASFLLVFPLDCALFEKSMRIGVEKATERRKKVFIYRSNNIICAYPMHNICWVTAVSEQANVYSRNSEKAFSSDNTGYNLGQLSCFIQIDSATWVNIARISEVRSDCIVLDDCKQTQLQIERGEQRRIVEAIRLFWCTAKI